MNVHDYNKVTNNYVLFVITEFVCILSVELGPRVEFFNLLILGNL